MGALRVWALAQGRTHKRGVDIRLQQEGMTPCPAMATIRSPKRGGVRRSEARLVRLTPAELAAWKAGLGPGESLSTMVRGAVEAELCRREEARELEAERRAANPFGLDELLKRVQRGA